MTPTKIAVLKAAAEECLNKPWHHPDRILFRDTYTETAFLSLIATIAEHEAAALTRAREEMRERAAQCAYQECCQTYGAVDVCAAIRTLPLTGDA